MKEMSPANLDGLGVQGHQREKKWIDLILVLLLMTVCVPVLEKSD